MTERIVTYNLKVVADKSNPKTLAKFLKDMKATHEAASKYSAKSTAARGKEAKKAADTGIKEAKRVTDAQTKASKQRITSVRQAARDERRERQGVLLEAVRATQTQAREEERARNTRMREEKRASDKIARESIKNHKAMERAGKRTWEATRTPLERYKQRVVELDGLLVKGVVSQDTHTRAVARAKTEMNQAGEAGRGAFGPKMLASVNRLTAAFGMGLGLTGAIRLFREELDAVAERAKRAKDATLTLQQAKEQAFINLGANTPEERAAFEISARRVATDLKRDPVDIYRSAAGTLASRGNLSPQAALNATKAGLRIRPGSVDEASSISESALDLMKAVPGLTAQDAVGFILATAERSRPKDPALVGLGAVPIIKAILATGDTAKEGGALFAALTQDLPDPTGKISKTSGIALVGQLRDLIPQLASKRLGDAQEQIRKASEPIAEARAALEVAELELAIAKKPSEATDRSIAAEKEKLDKLRKIRMPTAANLKAIGISRDKITDLEILGGPEQRLNRIRLEQEVSRRRADVQERQALTKKLPSLQQQIPRLKSDVQRTLDATAMDLADLTRERPELRTAFLEKASFRLQAKQPVRSFLTPGGTTFEKYQDFLGLMPEARDAGTQFRKKIGIQEDAPLAGIARADRAMKAAQANIRTRNRVGALSGIATEGIGPLIKDTGAAALPTWVTQKRADFAEMFGGEEAGIIERRAALERRRQTLLHPLGMKTSGWGVTQTFPREPTEKARADAADLKIVIDSLREELQRISVANETLIDETRQGTDATRDVNETLRDIKAQGDRPQGQSQTQEVAPSQPGISLPRNSGM